MNGLKQHSANPGGMAAQAHKRELARFGSQKAKKGDFQNENQYKKGIDCKCPFIGSLRIDACRFYLRLIYRHRNDFGEHDSGGNAEG